MDQGPLTHTNGGSPCGAPPEGGPGTDPILDLGQAEGQNWGVQGTPLWRGGLGPRTGTCPGRGGPNYPPRVTVGI